MFGEYKQQTDIADLFIKFVTENNGKGELEALRDKVKPVVYHYMFCMTEADFFRDQLVEDGSETAQRTRRDFAKIKKLSNDLMILLETTHAGTKIRDSLDSSRYTKRDWEVLSSLSSRAAEAEKIYTPDRGRNKSRDRQARIDLVRLLATLAREAGISTGTGQQGPFPSFIEDVYDSLSIEHYNLSEDLQKAIIT